MAQMDETSMAMLRSTAPFRPLIASTVLVDITTPESAIQDRMAKQSVLAQTMHSKVILGTRQWQMTSLDVFLDSAVTSLTLLVVCIVLTAFNRSFWMSNILLSDPCSQVFARSTPNPDKKNMEHHGTAALTQVLKPT